MAETLLSLKGIAKRFSGVVALDSVDFDVLAGEVHVLMGENGAGKSTLMKIIDGIYRPDAGTMHLFGHISSVQSPKEAQHKGIAMIHQELNNVLEMTVAENIFLGREPVRWGLLDRRRMNQDARKALAPIKLDIDPDTKMKCLSCAQMQMVEIAKAISYKARIIIMDEPTSAISDKEVDALFAIIAMLRTQGVGIVYISHKMNEVFRI
ncbi:MAG: ATP-binding cassette domain-containing protein, partial [Clostridia bacterium]